MNVIKSENKDKKYEAVAGKALLRNMLANKPHELGIVIDQETGKFVKYDKVPKGNMSLNNYM